jgi:hypothetical protein
MGADTGVAIAVAEWKKVRTRTRIGSFGKLAHLMIESLEVQGRKAPSGAGLFSYLH